MLDTKAFLKFRQKVDFKKLTANYQLVMFGDDHNMNKGREWLAREIKSDKSRIDFLGLEYIETSKQNLIAENRENKIVPYLKKTYKDFPGFDPYSVSKLVDLSRETKIKVEGIETPDATFINWEDIEAQEARIKYLAEKIIELSGNENQKGIVLLGADHVEKRNDNVYGLVQRQIKNLVSVVFVGGKDWTIDTEEYWIRKIEIGVINMGWENDFFALEVKNNEYPCDWIIHFPTG